MKSDFEFNKEFVPQNLITIDNIGDCCIEAIDEDNLVYYYLLVKTSMGMSEIYSYGPVIPDINDLLEFYTYSFEKVKYNDKKMYGYILKWLNDTKKHITTAKVIECSNFLDNNIDLNEFVNRWNK